MRPIQIENEVRVRFPAQPETFDIGVEVGMVTALMVQGSGAFRRYVSAAAFAHLAEVAPHFRYRAALIYQSGAMCEVQFSAVGTRPRLRVVT